MRLRNRVSLGPLRPSRRQVRTALALVVVVSALGVTAGYLTRPTTTDPPPADGVTVVTQQGRDQFGGTARVVAFGADGSVVYEDARYGAYFDVDPVAGTARTVEYVAVDFEPAADCPDRLAGMGDWCARNLVVRANLTTGDRRVVYERYLPRLSKLHDVDRVDGTTLAVANIYRDRVELVDTTTGEVTWHWNASAAYDYPDSGGPPDDWTHLNDVEVVRGGWLMLSLRNHDQVVFVEPGEGMREDWTLGCDDCHDVLFEQHNPDYVPRERGGPAVIVADSENDRVVEYRRTGGEWERTWTWTSSETAWPRDADRLPNGNTLVTDSHANRVVEVDEGGAVVWSVALGNPYEAERLGTGDESAGGRPHAAGHQFADGAPVDRGLITLRDALPSRAYSAALFAMPYWVGLAELLFAAVGTLVVVVWGLLEAAWFLRRRRLRRPADLWADLDR